jgi:hypothetical protein
LLKTLQKFILVVAKVEATSDKSRAEEHSKQSGGERVNTASKRRVGEHRKESGRTQHHLAVKLIP